MRAKKDCDKQVHPVEFKFGDYVLPLSVELNKSEGEKCSSHGSDRMRSRQN